MKKIASLFSLCLLALAFSCKEAHDKKLPDAGDASKKYHLIENAAWLLGRWENNSEEGNLSEFWTRANDSAYHGESYLAIKGDTVFREKIVLFESSRKLVYRVSAGTQKPVDFTMTGTSEKQLVWENPEHGYPSKIVYRKAGNDSLIAAIHGIEEGRQKSEVFKMKKVK
ncbi:MAG TPA: DUF6265 family protein [Flavobacterium sp.]|nr:DUF6265 family protein [Flavobacterium sp.]